MNKVFDIAGAIVIVAGIMVLVRPGSQGPKFVTSLGQAFAGAVGAATGGGSFTPSATGTNKRR